MQNGAKKILIADDDYPCQRVLSTILRRAGYQVTCVFDGHEALQYLKTTFATNESPDAILSDIQMPGCDGETFIGELRRCGTTIPIMIMTGDLESRTVTRLRASWNLRVISKPFSPQEILSAVSALVGTGDAGTPVVGG